MTSAVFFDVDFTLIYPGPVFQGEGYLAFCSRYGVEVDPSRFEAAVVSASHILDREPDAVYDPQIFIDYTAHIIRGMGGEGAAIAECAAEMYREWAGCQHFVLYEDVRSALDELATRGLLIGVISNSHRSLDAFKEHFELDGLIDVAVSSSEHGFMKPHPSIFQAALNLAGVPAAESMMVGDSLSQDVEGARRVGMRGVLVRRSDAPARAAAPDVPVIRSLSELPGLL